MEYLRRAIRRHHANRLKRKRSKYHNIGDEPSKKGIGKCYQTPCLCSCWMCGNQRRVYGAGIKELRDRLKYTD